MPIIANEFGWGKATLKCSFGKVARIFSLILPSPLSALLPSTGNNISLGSFSFLEDLRSFTKFVYLVEP